jgi:ubiquinone/menaquinone biosynthesis C-methylase UbiE/DNA-binding transcriptional ArsR family regulator
MNQMTAAPAMSSRMTALADATRGRLLRLLERQELTVAELCAVVQLPQSTVSRHLKVLADDGWVEARREATSRLYRMTADALDPFARRLWVLVREQTAANSAAELDDQRLQRILAERQTRSQAFFNSAAGQWDRLRDDLFGERFDLAALPALLDDTWTVGDLGCGTGQTAEAIAPYVQRVIAVDSSAPMLKAAKARLKAHANVDLRRGDLQSLPIDDAALDAAVMTMVLHHLADPAAVLAETARVMKPGAKLLLIDILQHDRREYQQQMGHVWLGFSETQITDWLTAAGFIKIKLRPLPTAADAKGPALFTATARKA